MGFTAEKNSQTKTEKISNILTVSTQIPSKLESDGGKEWYNSDFQNFLEIKEIHHYSRLTNKGPSICERVIKTIKNLLKKPISLKRNADCLSELPSVVKKYNNTIQSSKK